MKLQAIPRNKKRNPVSGEEMTKNEKLNVMLTPPNSHDSIFHKASALAANKEQGNTQMGPSRGRALPHRRLNRHRGGYSRK